MLSFEPRVGKVKIGLTSSGFTVIIPILIFNVFFFIDLGPLINFQLEGLACCPCCPFAPLYSRDASCGIKGMFISRLFVMGFLQFFNFESMKWFFFFFSFWCLEMWM